MDVPTASGNIRHLVAATHVGEFHHAVSGSFLGVSCNHLPLH